MSLDGTELLFENHLWRLGMMIFSIFNLSGRLSIASQGATGEIVHQQVTALKDQNRTLQEENQLLKFKMDVLLDMVRHRKIRGIFTVDL
jgi:hypothetical protein